MVSFLLRKNTVRRDDVEWYGRFKDLFCMKGVDMWRFVWCWIAVLTVGMATVWNKAIGCLPNGFLHGLTLFRVRVYLREKRRAPWLFIWIIMQPRLMIRQ